MKILNKFVCISVIFVLSFSYFYSPLPYLIGTYRMQLVDFLYFPMSIFSNIYEYLGAVFNIRDVVRSSEELQRELSDSKVRLHQLQSLKTENQELKALLKLKRDISFNSIPAEVIGRSRNGTSNVIVLSKGSSSGIAVDAYVVSELGLVGRVIEVADKTSKVILADDVNFKVEATVKDVSDGIGLVIGGMKDNICYMKYLSENADINVGDIVLTSGYSNLTPHGIPIGEIKSFVPSEDSFFKQAIINTYADLRRVRFVLCLKQE